MAADTEAGENLPGIRICPTLEQARKEADKFKAIEPVGVPGMQKSLFDAEPSGQKKLFDYVAPSKADSRKKKEADLLDGVNDRLKKVLKNKKTLSPADLLTNVTHDPLAGQREMF